MVLCGRVEGPIELKVASWSGFLRLAHPSPCHMEDIAWELRTDVRRGQIGFVNRKGMRLAERFVMVEDQALEPIVHLNMRHYGRSGTRLVHNKKGR